MACPSSWLSPAAPHHFLPSRSPSLPERCARKGEAPAPSRRAEVAEAAEGSLEGRKGRREKGRGGGERGWRAGQSNCVFVSSPVCTGGSVCVLVVGVALP